jgi:hypothetical protein
MRLEITSNDAVTPAIRRFVRSKLPDLRRQAVEHALREALAEAVRLNPVDTARSRAAWAASLEQLGGVPPAGWRGAHPTAEAEGRAAAALSREQDLDRSTAAASSAVPYVPLLEYGTSRLGPFAMVRTGLRRARRGLIDRLRRIFQ